MNREYKETLEKLLAYAKCDGDAINALASAVPTKDALFELSPDALAELIGESAARLITVSAALASRRTSELFPSGRRYTDEELTELICALFRGAYVESIYMLSLDRSGRVIASDFLGEGTVNYSDVVPIKVLERARRLRAASVIIAHNHPLGDTLPSSADFTSTIIIKELLGEAGIELISHYVVSSGKAKIILPEHLSAYV